MKPYHFPIIIELARGGSFPEIGTELRRLPLYKRDAVLAAQTQIALQDFEYIQGGEELAQSSAE